MSLKMPNESYFQLYLQIEKDIISNKSVNSYTKLFAILFCILIEVIVNIDGAKEISFHKESCETLLSGYFHHLHGGLQTGCIGESQDFKELREIVSLIQCDIETPSTHNKKMINELVSRAFIDK